ncbi:44502_t:CDS:2 [Gigaspora margarita]|uniref:44502_t:CDS:1 n=1 Tax=Gigaspora margarita TaxID=4874 RepID=A0ABM8VZ22_GIGMA|nr:44502_t:CDS:2 [Gigaspora margarita]
MNCSDVRQEAYNCSDVKPEQLENQETTNLKSQISQLQSENSSLRKECNENSSIISSLREQISKKHYSEYNTWHDANCDSCGLQIKGYRYKVVFIHSSYAQLFPLLKIIPQQIVR